MKREKIDAMLRAAIQQLIDEHYILLEIDINERTLTHHFANNIRQYVPSDLDVDVEYNRHYDDVKRLDLPDRQSSDRDTEATTVFPDIIVHRRNTDESNILVIEFKKPSRDISYDLLKLRAFREQLGYQHAAHVVVGITDDGTVESGIIWI